jgi:hypothetical protein
VHGILASALRWISDEPQPGWIEVEFIDADGRRWLVHDKPPMFEEPPDGFSPPNFQRSVFRPPGPFDR